MTQSAKPELRDLISAIIHNHMATIASGNSVICADAILSILPTTDRNSVIEECAAIADRLAKPDGSKKGALHHMHVGSVTAAFAIASTIRALKSEAQGDVDSTAQHKQGTP